jgi:hypothetical protein
MSGLDAPVTFDSQCSLKCVHERNGKGELKCVISVHAADFWLALNATTLLHLQSDSVYEVYLYAFTEALSGGGDMPVGIAIAEVDPYIFIDPTFELADEFTIVVSDGVGDFSGSSRIGAPDRQRSPSTSDRRWDLV